MFVDILLWRLKGLMREGIWLVGFWGSAVQRANLGLLSFERRKRIDIAGLKVIQRTSNANSIRK